MGTFTRFNLSDPVATYDEDEEDCYSDDTREAMTQIRYLEASAALKQTRDELLAKQEESCAVASATHSSTAPIASQQDTGTAGSRLHSLGAVSVPGDKSCPS